MRRTRAAAPFSLLLLATAAAPQALPGDVYVTERAAGSVVNVRGGGSFAGAPRFATGLAEPTGVCVTSEGAVLVAEAASGEVTDVANGGDMTGHGAFASGLEAPMDLLCDGERILVVEGSAGQQGQLTDITAGGDFTGAPAFAAGIGTGAAALLFDPTTERLFASDTDQGRIFDVTAGGVFLAVPPFASNGAGTSGLASLGAQILAANPGTGSVVDFTAGGDLAALPVFATVPGAVGLLPVGGLGLLAASASSDALYEISAGGDFGAAAPFASGLDLDPSFVGMAHFGGCGDGILDEGESCDDGNVADGDGCNASCRVRLCLTPPSNACVVAEHATLNVHEKEKRRGLVSGFSLSLKSFGEAVSQSDFGLPVFDTTRYDVCVYGQDDDLVAQMIVPRGFDTCGEKGKSCWQSLGDRGYKYSDPGLDSAGIGSIVAVGGAAGKGSLQVRGKRKRGEDRLPRMTGALEGDTSATVQVMVSDGRCFGAELPEVKRADGEKFQARK
jgi:cysteine-rich repeat protein